HGQGCCPGDGGAHGRLLPPPSLVLYGAMPRGKPREQGDTAVVTEKKSKTQKPRLWKVLLHNDDYTTMEFVIHVLETVFNKEPAVAHDLMLQVHTRGMCVAGVYTYEIAETKVTTVEQMARAAEYPFLCTMEPE
ncbi:MAG: ATP-dependent Clp protease adaptor ClpS, partial [Bdellovibrionota bacterium]